ncbi:hypothetical protein J5289_18735 [Rhizobium sp. B230/85]|uniref:NAD(P)-dependent oxidoreductase n=2 Tax=unclassified Rhizobium TaxID=2613769 RepID=UPI001C5BCD72|nr:NAD(P)-dependent oxidoreductase [Rhizobium sp. B230/85]QXZ98609.1 hypothetical protein J5289_18735 [Rhizobium sp. B230/85]
MVTPGEGCPGHSISPYLSQNTKNLIAALHSTPRTPAILEQTLSFPVLKSDDSLGKRLVDNPHGTSQSLIATILDVTQKLLAGKVFLVFGFGRVGAGLAEKARGLGARVIVAETRPTRALIAALSGFEVSPCMESLPLADIVCTVTGRRGVLGRPHFDLLKNGVVLVNGGHLPFEIDVAALKEQGAERPFSHGMSAHALSENRTIYLVADGHIANLTVGKGNPNEVMDVTFASQVMALVHAKGREFEARLHDLPKDSESEVAHYVAETLGLDVSRLA